MNKKSVAASTLVVFMAIFFSIVGICFSSFVFKFTKIEVKDVLIARSEGIEVFEDEDLSVAASALKLSNMELGIKPATGELDADTKIPSTINDEGTSEGYYSTVYVKTNVDFKVVVKDIKIESDKNKLDVEEERENIWVAIKDVENAVKNLKENEVELALFQDVQTTQKITIFIWLDSLSGESLEGAKISFVIDFIAV